MPNGSNDYEGIVWRRFRTVHPQGPADAEPHTNHHAINVIAATYRSAAISTQALTVIVLMTYHRTTSNRATQDRSGSSR